MFSWVEAAECVDGDDIVLLSLYTQKIKDSNLSQRTIKAGNKTVCFTFRCLFGLFKNLATSHGSLPPCSCANMVSRDSIHRHNAHQRCEEVHAGHEAR